MSCDDHTSTIVSCTNLWGNAGGDWVGVLSDQAGLRGNLAMDPMFCDTIGYELKAASPCAAGSGGCDRIGALPVGCDVGVAETSWGKVKVLYR